MKRISYNVVRLHAHEEALRAQAMALVDADPQLALHLDVGVHAMDLCYVLRQFPTADEDLKVVQLLAMRTFNAFSSATKLLLSGYAQNSALILRDVLECIFLVDLFRTDRPAITRWRTSDRRARLAEFQPVKVRKVLDVRDGLTTQKRCELYRTFSEMAGHPSMLSAEMFRPKGEDAKCGPFLDETILKAVIGEAGPLAVQVGLVFGAFIPKSWHPGMETKLAFDDRQAAWVRTFWPTRTPDVEPR